MLCIQCAKWEISYSIGLYGLICCVLVIDVLRPFKPPCGELVSRLYCVHKYLREKPVLCDMTIVSGRVRFGGN